MRQSSLSTICFLNIAACSLCIVPRPVYADSPDVSRIKELVLSIPLPTPEAVTTEEPVFPTLTSYEDGSDGLQEVQRQQIRMARQLSNMTAYGVKPNVIWPGALVQGKNLSAGSPDALILDRAPGRISIALYE